MFHYTYITKHKNGKYYVGRHSTKNLNDEYFGSGKWIRSLKNKDELTKTILNFYESKDELLKAEKALIEIHINNEMNMNFNKSAVGFSSDDFNPSKSLTRRKQMSEAITGNKNPMSKGHTEASKQKIKKSLTGEKNPMHGKTHNDEARKKISNANKGRIFSDETKKIWSEQRKGKPAWNSGTKGKFTIGDLGKEKISKSWEHRKKVLCQHCNNEFMPNTYKRWHGDNCKFK